MLTENFILRSWEIFHQQQRWQDQQQHQRQQQQEQDQQQHQRQQQQEQDQQQHQEQQQQEQDQQQQPGLGVEPKQRWFKYFRGALAANNPKDRSFSGLLKASPMLLVCLIITIIFIVGAIIVIALIPIYLRNKSADAVEAIDSNKKNVTIEIDIDQTLPVGPMSDAELTKLLDVIKASLPESLLQNSNMRIIGAEIVLVPITKRRDVRQAGFKKVLRLIFELVAAVQSVLQTLQTALSGAFAANVQVIQQAVAQAIENRPSTTSTSTVSSNLISTVASGRRRRRLEEHQQTLQPLVTYED